MNYLLAAFLAVASPAAYALDACWVTWEQDGTCSQHPGPGSGLVDGVGWVHCEHAGYYTFHGGTVRGKTSPELSWCGENRERNIGAFVPIQQTSSRLEWTRPDGVREVIPQTDLYP